VFDNEFPNTLDPELYITLEVIVCTFNVCAVNVPATVKLFANDEVNDVVANEELVAFEANDALVANEELVAFEANDALVANDEETAFKTYDAVAACNANDDVPNNEPVNEPLKSPLNDPVLLKNWSTLFAVAITEGIPGCVLDDTSANNLISISAEAHMIW
jgi:hypothetical protein